MAATAVQLLNPDDTFQKLEKLYSTMNQKTLKCNTTDFEYKWQIKIRAELELIPEQERYFQPIESKKKQKKKKLKGQERKNHLVKKPQTELQPIGTVSIPPPPTPNEWFVILYILYFNSMLEKLDSALQEAENEVNYQIETTKSNLSEEELRKLHVVKEDIGSLLKTMESINHHQGSYWPPQLIEMDKCVGRLQETFDQLEDAQIPALLKSTIKPSKQQYLASILGLDQEVVGFLTDDCDNYLTDEQWILEFLEIKEEALTGEECDSWEEAFKKLGFNPLKSELLGTLAEDNLYSGHDSPGQWAARHIEQQFKDNILLPFPGSGNGFKVASIITSHENEVPYEIPTMFRNPINVSAINKFSIDTNKENLADDPTYKDFLSQSIKPMEKVTYWFHGTDWFSALNIIQKGIDVSKGRKQLDFSDGSGFYLTRYIHFLYL